LQTFFFALSVPLLYASYIIILFHPYQLYHSIILLILKPKGSRSIHIVFHMKYKFLHVQYTVMFISSKQQIVHAKCWFSWFYSFKLQLITTWPEAVFIWECRYWILYRVSIPYNMNYYYRPMSVHCLGHRNSEWLYCSWYVTREMSVHKSAS